MSRLLKRWISAACILCAPEALADIPMVTTPMVTGALLPVRAAQMPRLPETKVLTFAPVRVALREEAPMAFDLSAQSSLSPFGTRCEVEIVAAPEAGALISVSVFAPCAPYETVTVYHEGIAVSRDISLTGFADLMLPALAKDVELRIVIDEETTLLHLEMADFEKFARVVLTSDDEDPTQLEGTDVEVFRADGLQVLSVDLRNRSALRVHRLVLSRTVTPQNCGRVQEAELRRIVPGQTHPIQTLRFAAMDCARVGDIQRLKNIIQDLKLASR